MVQLNFNVQDVEPDDDFDPLPDGKYNAVISDSAMKKNSTGDGSRLELTFTILDGPYANRRVWENLNLVHSNATTVRISKKRLRKILDALGIVETQHSEELHNIPLVLNVGCKPRSDGNGLANTIKGFEAAFRSGAPTAPVAPPSAARPAASPYGAPPPAQPAATPVVPPAPDPATPPW